MKEIWNKSKPRFLLRRYNDLQFSIYGNRFNKHLDLKKKKQRS